MMDAYRLSVWLHIVFGIVLVGQALFWFVMLVALRRRFDATATRQWLTIAKGARWPHVLVPYALRLPLPVVAWSTLVVLVLTGIHLISQTHLPQGNFWAAKLWLLAGIALTQGLLSWRPIPPVIVVNLLLTLSMMMVSAWMVRG
jgi:hypothetical protein